MPPFITRIQQFFRRLSTGQQAGLALVAVGTVALLFGTAYWSNQPDYTLLFGNLEASDANGVVEVLREEGTPYDLRDRGTAIYVPRASVHELRLRFASEGMVSEGQVGYELFDQGTLGMTDFMQKLNLKRALEGELSRTISSMGQLERARVHLVMPERNPFRGERTEPSASVVVNMQRGSLAPAQVEGITALVAGAVEGMTAAQVTVLDTEGNMLSNPAAAGSDVALTSTQLDLQRSVEEHLVESGQSMLKKVLGPGNALVRVSAELDFDRTVSEHNTVDPESATIISEEQMQEGAQGNGENTNATSRVRNYEVSRSRERSEEGMGDVSRLTVAVILNHKLNHKREGGEMSYVPRTAQELSEVESLVKNAVGFNPDRGDRFTIQQQRFDTSRDAQTAQTLREQREEEQMRLYLRYGLIALALIAAVWAARSLAGRLTRVGSGAGGIFQLQQGASTPELSTAPDAANVEARGRQEEEMVLVDDIYTSKLSAEAKAHLKARSKMFEEIQEQAQERPEETAELIRSWLISEPA